MTANKAPGGAYSRNTGDSGRKQASSRRRAGADLHLSSCAPWRRDVPAVTIGSEAIAILNLIFSLGRWTMSLADRAAIFSAGFVVQRAAQAAGIKIEDNDLPTVAR